MSHGCRPIEGSSVEEKKRKPYLARYRGPLLGEAPLKKNHTERGDDQFLINPYGLLYEQITASSLVKIDVDGNMLDETPYEVNRAGFVIHSAIHMARPDLHAMIHTHTPAGQAVSALSTAGCFHSIRARCASTSASAIMTTKAFQTISASAIALLRRLDRTRC